MTAPQQPQQSMDILGADGKPVRQAKGKCPRCQAPASSRVQAFGKSLEVCDGCGYQFPEGA